MSERIGLLSVPENDLLSFSGRNRNPSDHSLEADDPFEYGEISGDQLREEVEALVRDTLPGEIDYVEEMLSQFRGREDQLLKALRRIQMRSNDSSCVSVDPDDFLFEDEGKVIRLDADLRRRDSNDQVVVAIDTSQILRGDSQGETVARKSLPNYTNEASNMEEKKNDFLPVNILAHEEDETDVLPEELPFVVQTSSMRNLKVSNLIAQSSLRDLDASSKSTSRLNVPSRRKAVALMKLRSWDPAKPEQRLKCLAAMHILLQSHKSTENAEEAFPADPRTVAMHVNEISSSRNPTKKLSMVKGEPKNPPHRGDSYFEEGADNLMGKTAASELVKIGDTDNYVSGGSCRELCVGSLVGIQLKRPPPPSSDRQNHSSSAASASSASSYTPEQKYEWRIGNSISMKKVCFLDLTDLPKLHRQIENNFSSLCELVMDGLPPSSFEAEEAELIFEALGTNTSIKRLSMRYSNVDDDLASFFALALVDNTSIFQLSLEGNEMTNVSAKNFYSVLKQNNEILRLLDLSNNPMIDDDVQNALDHFMEQRALKRTLTSKAEKAKRAAKGMPPDAALGADQDVVSGQITVVCHWSMMGYVAVHSNSQQQSQAMSNFEKIGTEKPYRGESFRDYMQRMDQVKENVHQSASYHQKLSEDSIRERIAFENFAPSESLLEQKSQVFLKQAVESPTIAQSPGPPTESLGDSISSSITTRSTNKQGTANDIITTTSDNEKKLSEPADRSRAPPRQMESLETQQSADPTVDKAQKRLGHWASLETQESDNDSTASEIAKRSFITMVTEASEAPFDERNFANQDLGISLTLETPGTTPHPFHNTQVSEGSNPSIQISEEDYMDDKADEIAMRRRLATSAGLIGAYHIDEAAPARQNLGGGRRGRRSRSESQRRARLAQLAGVGGDTEDTAPVVDESLDSPEVILNAAAQATADMFPSIKRRKSRLSAIGLDDEESGMDKIIFAILALLLVALLVMIILLVVK